MDTPQIAAPTALTRPPSPPLGQALFHAVGRLRSAFLLRGFERGARRAREVNRETLKRILTLNASCEVGRRYHFSELAGLGEEAWRDRVPLSTWPDVTPYIERMARGEVGILTSEPVLYFCISSGTTGAAKRVPATASSFAHQRRYYTGLNPAAAASLVPHGAEPYRGLLLLTVAGAGAHTEAGIPVGMASAHGLARVKRIAPWLWTSPWPVFEVPGTEPSWYLHALFALRERTTRFLNAVFAPQLLSWLRFVERRWGSLVEDIERGQISSDVEIPAAHRAALSVLLSADPRRARELRLAVEGGFDGFVTRVWPWLRYAATVITGPFEVYVPSLRHYLGGLPIHTTCLSSSEGMLGLNLDLEHPNRYILAVGANHFEMIPEGDTHQAQPRTRLLSELEVGERYELVLTNFAGLYRYRLGDIVEVVDFHHEAPVLAFQWRSGSVLDLVGEKTTEPQAREAIQGAVAALGGELVDYTLRGDVAHEPPRYVVYVEAALPTGVDREGATQQLEEALRAANPVYGIHRGGQRLGTIAVRWLRPGAFYALEGWRERRDGAIRNQMKTPRPIKDPGMIQCLEEWAL